MRSDSVRTDFWNDTSSDDALYKFHYHISVLTLTASLTRLNGSGAMEANLTTNRNKIILAGILKIRELIAIDMAHTLYIRDF